MTQPTQPPCGAQNCPKMAATSEQTALVDKFVTTAVHEDVLDHTVQTGQRVIAIAVDETPEASHAVQWTLEHLVNLQGNDQVCFFMEAHGGCASSRLFAHHGRSVPLAQVVLINVRPYAVPSNYVSAAEFYPAYSNAFNTEYVEAMEHSNREVSHNILKKLGETVLAKGVACRGIALRGDARDEIALKVKEIHADILVTGTRGEGPFGKAIHGSLSDYLIHHVDIPVVVAKLHHK
ncbi:hypothetical protein BC830DRAFT_359731 [Chytriomyces sp. MP71]|nr:hypothetical protein BC830DRAFT_359731 [Chytriomyces sp. MP71]